MGARSFTELDAWRLANDLKLGIYALIRTRHARLDPEFLSQIRNAPASAPRNIAEGFGRFLPREFSHYLRIANGSLMETSNHLQGGVDRRYFTAGDRAPADSRATGIGGGDGAHSLSADGSVVANPSTQAPKNLSTST